MNNIGVRGQGSRVKIFFICSLSTICYLLPTVVWADELDAIVAKVQKTYDGIQDIQANFTQFTTSASIKQTQKAEGVVYFKKRSAELTPKPGMMKWEYKSPGKDIIVSDGMTIWVYQQDIGQVMVGNAIDDNGTSISNNFLAGMGNLKKDFDIELAEQDNAAYLLKLNPKTSQPNVQKLYIAVDKKTFFMVKTIVYDMLGNETKVIFENMKANQSLSANIFKFKIPEGVKVVK
ncbi:MAG: outer membrane lipoprotein chaperone LolA [Deltaproteobacteria bacterium]|nr:outer membrane lipoprotein chaperone LolA [Deltaproteobacteria bacterium]